MTTGIIAFAPLNHWKRKDMNSSSAVILAAMVLVCQCASAQLETAGRKQVMRHGSRPDANQFGSTVRTLGGREITRIDMDRYITGEMDSLNTMGVSLAIINDAKVVYHFSHGVADAYSQDTVNDETLFEAASLSKPVFAYFTMRLVEKGVLNLDTPLCRYFAYPDLEHDPQNGLITARMVLDHTSGLPNWRSNNPANEMEGTLNIQFPPGSRFSYSGEGYVYLANVIAHLSHRSLLNLDSLFQQEVAQPLHLKHTYFGMNVYVAKHLACGHDGDRIVYDNSWPRKGFYPAGGMYTESLSYANFLIAIMENEGLMKASFNEMLGKQTELPEDEILRRYLGYTEWGLGFGRQPSEYGMNLSHPGNNIGYTSFFLMNKEKKFGFVFFCNSNQRLELILRLENFLTSGEELHGKN